ncbi:MAG TPA: SDR family oxidoreductase [Verrucomicrobiae bacterium]|jgi:NAD(P)-dependent dehydrogenase (short-subunit alcohol dehydrogenase family)|nr:SDR family oxidoreductase [Verrucomicrobiae bacterium]
MKPRHDPLAPATRRQPTAQRQAQPGKETKMNPEPVTDDPRYLASGKLRDQAAIISGGDSGIGRAVAIAFAKEGADVAIIYLNEDKDADRTVAAVEELGRRCLKLRGDVGSEKFCQNAVKRTLREFGRLDIVVNNAAEQHVVQGIEDTTERELEDTFRTNFFGYVFLAKAALPHLKSGAAIINTTSVQAYKPKPTLLAYAATKAAILDFTRALATELAPKGIRVNAVAPGPVWTPLIPATFPAAKVAEFGKDSPLGRAAQPCELAPAYVFLASALDSSYIIGQVIHVNGGKAMMS